MNTTTSLSDSSDELVPHAPTTFHSWLHLPAELKLLVLEHLIPNNGGRDLNWSIDYEIDLFLRTDYTIAEFGKQLYWGRPQVYTDFQLMHGFETTKYIRKLHVQLDQSLSVYWTDVYERSPWMYLFRRITDENESSETTAATEQDWTPSFFDDAGPSSIDHGFDGMFPKLSSLQVQLSIGKGCGHGDESCLSIEECIEMLRLRLQGYESAVDSSKVSVEVYYEQEWDSPGPACTCPISIVKAFQMAVKGEL